MIEALEAGILYLCVLATIGVFLKIHQLWIEYVERKEEEGPVYY